MTRLSSDTACVATVTDDAYLPGTLVLLSSFLRHNAWFHGHLVVIHDGLTEDSREQLARFPNLRFHPVGPALETRLAALAALPKVGRKLPHLFSLEAFNLPGYDWILALDSDILCLGNLEPLIEMDAPLVCCPDQSYFWEQVRDRRTYVPMARPAAVAADIRSITFNVGVMKIAPRRLSPSVFADLVNQVSPGTWADVRTGHTDSVLLNQHFRGAWTQAPDTFNYLISGGMALYTRGRAPLRDAVLLHFLGKPKPWQPEAAAAAHTMDPERRAAFALWDAAWTSARTALT